METDTGRLRYWIGFNRAKGIGPARLRALIDHFGDVEQAWRASPAALRQARVLDERTLESLIATRDHLNLEAELEALDHLGCQVLLFDDAEFPPLLREIPDPPSLIYLKGSFTAADRRAVAVVGTRRATEYGKTITRQICNALAQAGLTIVSGLAGGIDAIAHQAALEVGGRSIAVLPCGIDRLYPPEHHALADAIVAQGALITEFARGTLPERWNFAPRNRIVSGLSLAVLVTEAPEKSGALVTAEIALNQGRDVFAVPGNALSQSSAGTNGLIRSGAKLVTRAEDVLEELGLDHEIKLHTKRVIQAIREKSASTYLPADAPERAIIGCLQAGGQHVDDLVQHAALDIAQVISTLTILEMKGVVQQTGTLVYALATAPDGR